MLLLFIFNVLELVLLFNFKTLLSFISFGYLLLLLLLLLKTKEA